MGDKLNSLLLWSNPYNHNINRNSLQKITYVMKWDDVVIHAPDMSGIALVYNSDKNNKTIH